jgi:DNA-binding NarL/FixJ family response regulator
VPAEGDFEPLGVWPLSLPNQRVGALQVTFAASPEIDGLRADVGGVSAVLALYLSLLASVAASPDRAVEMLNASDQASLFSTSDLAVLQSARGGAAARRPAPSILTERQNRILHLMAKGLTNSQIAKRVGFSESTVRQETMVIYRFFGVGGRREAVRLAGLRGMLGDAEAK